MRVTNSMWDFLNCKNDAEFDKLCLRFTKWATKDLENLQKKNIKLEGKELLNFLQQKKQEALKMGGQIFCLHRDIRIKYKEKRKYCGKTIVDEKTKVVKNYQMPLGEYLYKVEQICRKDKEPEEWKIQWQDRWENIKTPGETPRNEYDLEYAKVFREIEIDKRTQMQFKNDNRQYLVFPPHQETPPCQTGIMGRHIAVYFPDLKHDGGKIDVDKMMAWAKENGYDTCQHFFMGNENLINSKDYYNNLPFMDITHDTYRSKMYRYQGEDRLDEYVAFELEDLYKEFEAGKCPPPHEWDYQEYIKYLKEYREKNKRVETGENTWIELDHPNMIHEIDDEDPMYGCQVVYDQRKGCFNQDNPFVPKEAINNIEFAVFWDNSIDWLEARQAYTHMGIDMTRTFWDSEHKELSPQYLPYPITGSPAADFIMDKVNVYANFKEYLPNCTEEDITRRIVATFKKYPENRAFYDMFPDRREVPYRNMYCPEYNKWQGTFIHKSEYTSIAYDPYTDQMATFWWVDDCPFDFNNSKYGDMICSNFMTWKKVTGKNSDEFYDAFKEMPFYPKASYSFEEGIISPNAAVYYDNDLKQVGHTHTIISSKLPKFYEFKNYEFERVIAANEMAKPDYAPPKHFSVPSVQEAFAELKENSYESTTR